MTKFQICDGSCGVPVSDELFDSYEEAVASFIEGAGIVILEVEDEDRTVYAIKYVSYEALDTNVNSVVFVNRAKAVADANKRAIESANELNEFESGFRPYSVSYEFNGNEEEVIATFNVKNCNGYPIEGFSVLKLTVEE